MDEKIKNYMRANKAYLKNQGVSFNADDLENELNDTSEDYTGHRYGGGKIPVGIIGFTMMLKV